MQYREQSSLVVPPAAPGVSGLQPYQMRIEQYRQEVVVICVQPEMVQGQLRIVCADEASRENLRRYARIASAAVGMPESTEQADRWLESQLEMVLDEDSYHVAPLGLPPLLVVKKSALDRLQIAVAAAVDLAHLDIVTHALGHRMPVPEAVLDEYKLRQAAPRELH